MARRTPGQSAGLSRDRIAVAGLHLVDREGLESFGVRPLASALGVDPMSIYNHVKGKAALLDAVSEAVLAEIAAPWTGWPDDWPGLARAMARAYRDLAIRHPRVFPLLATRAQTSASALEAVERLVAAMRGAGVADQVVADAPMVLFGFLNGYLLATVSARPDAPTDGDPGRSVDQLLDASQHPTLAALAHLQAGFGGDAEFERMLDMVLSGLAEAATRAAGP